MRGDASRADHRLKLFRHTRLPQPLYEDVPVSEIGESLGRQLQAERRPDLVGGGEKFLRLADQAQMPATADELVVMTGVASERGDRRTHERKCLLETARG